MTRSLFRPEGAPALPAPSLQQFGIRIEAPPDPRDLEAHILPTIEATARDQGLPIRRGHVSVVSGRDPSTGRDLIELSILIETDPDGTRRVLPPGEATP